MKRLTRLLLLLAVIGLPAFLLTVNLRPEPEVVDLLPADTIALVEWDNLARSWEAWRGSTIGIKVHDPQFSKILEQLGAPGARIAGFTAGKAFLDRLTNAPFFNWVFANKAAVALLPKRDGQPFSPVALLRHLVLIVPQRIGFPPQSQLEEFFGPVRSTSATPYQGVSLVTYSFDFGETLTFCRYRRLLICSLDADTVRRCIDQLLNRMVQPRTGLVANPEYQGLKKDAGGQTDFFFYADLAVLLRQLPAPRKETTPESGLVPHHFAVFHRAEAERDRLTIIAQVRPDRLTAFTTQHRLASPSVDSVGQRLSSEPQFYLWTNWFNLKTLWDLGLHMGDQEAGGLMLLLAQRVIEGAGKTSDDFFDVFGDRFGVFITGPQVPLRPDRSSMACLYVEIRDQQEVEAMLKRLFRGLQVITVVTEGTKISSLNIASGLVQPAFALMDGHLLLADSVELIEQVQRQGGVMPTTGNRGPAAAGKRTGNFFVFVRTKNVAEQLKAILTLVIRELAGQENILPQKTRLLIEHVWFPVLTSLQGVEFCGLRGYAAGDEVILEMDFGAGREGFPLFSPESQ